MVTSFASTNESYKTLGQAYFDIYIPRPIVRNDSKTLSTPLRNSTYFINEIQSIPNSHPQTIPNLQVGQNATKLRMMQAAPNLRSMRTAPNLPAMPIKIASTPLTGTSTRDVASNPVNQTSAKSGNLRGLSDKADTSGFADSAINATAGMRSEEGHDRDHVRDQQREIDRTQRHSWAEISPEEGLDAGVHLGVHTQGHSISQILFKNLRNYNFTVPFITILTMLCCMIPNNRPRGGGTRDPPAWGPEMADRYPFEYWVQDLFAWSILVNDQLGPSQQASAIMLQLLGSARDLCRELSYQERTQGGLINGV